jgi:uncharacterized membrane protein YfcA
VLRWCVALYCCVVAAQMAFGGPRGGAARDAVVPTGWPMAAAGGGIGAVSAVVGIGGGSLQQDADPHQHHEHREHA